MTDADTPDSTGSLLRETAHRVFADCCTTVEQRGADAGVWQQGAWDALAEAGLHRALLPENAGGYGVATEDALSLVRVAAEYALPLPLAETMLAHWLLADAGLAVTEGPLTVTADLIRVPWGRDVSGLVRLAEGQVALFAPSAWAVAAGQNVAREPRDTMTIIGEALASAPSRFDAGALRAAGAAMRTQQIAGALTRLTAMTTQYAQDRTQFGRPIGKFQAVQQNLAVLAGQTAAAVAAADIAAEAFANGVKRLPIAAAKARAGEAAGIGAAIAHQVHGAIGFTAEHSLHFLTRRLWSWRDEFGNEATWNRFVGQHMAAAGGGRLWAEIVAA